MFPVFFNQFAKVSASFILSSLSVYLYLCVLSYVPTPLLQSVGFFPVSRRILPLPLQGYGSHRLATRNASSISSVLQGQGHGESPARILLRSGVLQRLPA